MLSVKRVELLKALEACIVIKKQNSKSSNFSATLSVNANYQVIVQASNDVTSFKTTIVSGMKCRDLMQNISVHLDSKYDYLDTLRDFLKTTKDTLIYVTIENNVANATKILSIVAASGLNVKFSGLKGYYKNTYNTATASKRVGYYPYTLIDRKLLIQALQMLDKDTISLGFKTIVNSESPIIILEQDCLTEVQIAGKRLI